MRAIAIRDSITSFWSEINDIMIVWDDSERDNEDDGCLPIFGKLYVSKELLNLM
jgi:hypothetical protein